MKFLGGGAPTVMVLALLLLTSGTAIFWSSYILPVQNFLGSKDALTSPLKTGKTQLQKLKQPSLKALPEGTFGLPK